MDGRNVRLKKNELTVKKIHTPKLIERWNLETKYFWILKQIQSFLNLKQEVITTNWAIEQIKYSFELIKLKFSPIKQKFNAITTGL
jgi:hypothetical protein